MQLLTECLGSGDDHAAQLDEGLPAGRRLRRDGRPSTAQRFLSLARSGNARSSVPTLTGGRTASSGSSLPRSRRSARGHADALEHDLATRGSVTSKAGPVVPGAFDRPDPRSLHQPGDPNAVSYPRPLAAIDRCATTAPVGARDDREHVLVTVCVDTDDEIHLVCKHPTDPPARLLGSGTPVWCRETAAAGL